MLKGLGQLGDMAKMMKQAQEAQAKMAQMQEDLNNVTVTGESGAGLVKATATAKGELKALDIDPSIFNGDDKEVVEDLILAAIKDAQTKAAERAQEEMQKIAGDLGLPADFKMPKPLSLEQSVASLRTKPGLRVELVAAEPMVKDPVSLDFGPDGKLWVVEHTHLGAALLQDARCDLGDLDLIVQHDDRAAGQVHLDVQRARGLFRVGKAR